MGVSYRGQRNFRGERARDPAARNMGLVSRPVRALTRMICNVVWHCSCQDSLAEMVHTKDGSRVVREFLARGSAKVRQTLFLQMFGLMSCLG